MLPLTIIWARPSTMAVLPTPGSPMRTGLFFVRRDSTCMTRSISRVRPMTGSSLPSRASWVRLRPNWSRTGEPFGSSGGAAGHAGLLACAGRSGLAARVAAQQLDDLGADAVEVRAELLEHLRGDALALTDQPEQDVLGADVVVAELQRLAQRQLEHLLRPRGEGDVAGGRGLALADDLLDLLAHALERDAEGLEGLGGNTLALVDQAEQDVLGPDVVVVEHPGLFLREDDHAPGPVGEAFEHQLPPAWVPRRQLYHRAPHRERSGATVTSRRAATSGSEQPRETAGATTRLIVHYIRRHGGDAAVSALLAAAGETRDVAELEDEHSWSSYDAKIALFEAAAEVTGDPQVARRIGEAVITEQVAAPVKVAIAALGSPQRVLRSVAMANAKFSTNSTMRCVESSRGRAVVTYRLDDGHIPSIHDCAYTQGVLSQATVLFGQPPASVAHLQCQVQGAEECVFEVTWPQWRSRLDRLLRREVASDVEVRALRQQLENLQRTGAEIVSSADLDALLARIATRASTAIRAQRYLLAVHLEQEQRPRVHADGFAAGEELAAGEALLAAAPVSDADQLIVEVASATRHYGRLAAYMPGKGFLPQERALLEAYASLAAAALDNATALTRAKRGQEVSDALLELAGTLAAVETTMKTARAVVTAVPRIVGASRAVLMIFDPARGRSAASPHAGSPPKTRRMPRRCESPASRPLSWPRCSPSPARGSSPPTTRTRSSGQWYTGSVRPSSPSRRSSSAG
jgi:hypothetical protein